MALGNTQFPMNVLVVSPLTPGAILGLDFLQQSNATIDRGGGGGGGVGNYILEVVKAHGYPCLSLLNQSQGLAFS